MCRALCAPSTAGGVISRPHVRHRAFTHHRPPGPAAAWSGGDERACPGLGTTPHPRPWTGRPQPALALAHTPENGLHFTPNSPLKAPCARPRRPGWHRTEGPAGAQTRPGTGGRPGARGYDPLSKRRRGPRRASCRDRISPTFIRRARAASRADSGVSWARTPDIRLFVSQHQDIAPGFNESRQAGRNY